MADANTVQKRPRGRPRKNQQVVAAAEAPVIDIVLDTALAKPNKSALTKTKKLKDESKAVPSAKTAPDKKMTKKSITSSRTNGSVTITKQNAATTKQIADPPAAAAAVSITPPSSAPQASSTATPPQRRKAAEPIPDSSAKPTGIIPSGANPVEKATATTANRSKILSELAAQGTLPLQREETSSGTEAARAEEELQAQRAPLCDIVQQEEAQPQATTGVVGEEIQKQEEIAHAASASAATPVTLSGRSTQTKDAAAQLEPLSSPASAITPPSPPPTKAAIATTQTAPPPPTQTTPITMAHPQPPLPAASQAPQPRPPPPQPFRASPGQARPPQPPPAPAAPPPVEELREPSQLRQRGQQQQSKWKPVEPLPKKYKPAARRVVLAMVAAPIAIVTSFALYDRLVLGKERKEMPRVAPSLANAVKDRDAEDKKM